MSLDSISLNVRGDILETSVEALTQVPGSGLEAMFSGRHSLTKVGGRPFVDKDPAIFKHLIWHLENDFLIHEDLRAEKEL